MYSQPTVLNDNNASIPIAKDIYNKIAERYATVVDNAFWNAGVERPATLSLLPTELKGKHVLDAACGSGFYSEYLFKHGSEVLGLDISSAMIAQYNKRMNGKTKAIEHDLSKPLTFIKDEEFDIVLSPLTLHYLPDWIPFFKEIYRILKKGGSWIFSIPHPVSEYFERHRDGNYFKNEAIVEHWDSYGEQEIEMKFYKRPLSILFETYMNTGFILEKFVEPQPIERSKEIYPQFYEKYMKVPCFICIQLKK